MMLKNNRISMTISLFRQAYGGYKWQVIVLTLFGFLNGILGGLGVNAVVPLLAFVSEKSTKEMDFISQTIEKLFVFVNVDFCLKYLLIFICFLFILKAIVLIITNYIMVKITANYENKTRNNLFKDTLRASWPYLLKQRVGYLETILMKDVGQSTSLLSWFSSLIIVITSLLVYVLVALNISVVITLLMLGLGGILFVFFKRLAYRTRILTKDVASTHKEVAHYVSEKIIGAKTIKAMSMERPILTKCSQYFDKLMNLVIKRALIREISGAILQPVSLIFISVVFAFSYKLTSFDLAAFVVIIYLIQRIFSFFQSAQSYLHKINEGVPYLRAVLDYKKSAVCNQESNNGKLHFQFNRALEFRNINFSYTSGKLIFSNLSFGLRRGEMLGLIGPSGVGKTTVVDLLLRLFVPNKGKILLDEKDISNISIEQWRKNIGYVSQDIFLLNDTIKNNIRFYNDSVSDKDIDEAAQMANIYDFIQGLPEKFLTKIGERGVLLSNGQRQRIILARALAKHPKILILDEATSALDNESEMFIQKAIKLLKGKLTVLIIAHRLSTILDSDRLLVLEKGKIIEQGAPKKLLENKKSYFYKLYNVK